MAYTIHITKKNHWIDEEPKITQEEWDTLMTNGVLELVDDKKYDAWDAKKDNLYFSFSKGNINCHPPDDASIQKIKEIASVIGAKVQGDDGEFY